MRKFVHISIKSLMVIIVAIIIGTLITDRIVHRSAQGRMYDSVAEIPHRHVGLLLGTSPLNRNGRPNSYFVNRIKATAELFHSGKIDYVIASGDNQTVQYNEPFAMRDALIAHGVPSSRIVLDYAGFRTLDSVVRAKEVFGCDAITIISQSEHCERALFLAHANGVEAVAYVAPTRTTKRTRVRMAVRELMARNKMMLDIISGKRPHFLGNMIPIP